MSPMCQYMADAEGRVTAWHRLHYPTRAVGGVALVMVEASAVEARGRISPRDLGLWQDSQVPGLAELASMIRAHGAVAGIQLAHAGRKAEGVGIPVAPSALPFRVGEAAPLALELEELPGIVAAFEAAARRARDAGFQVIEIHAAHGYLLNQFLSSLTNQRQDAYGGDLFHRFRLLEAVVVALRRIWEGPLWVRISAEEYEAAGHHLAEAVAVARLLKPLGIDLLDVSSGGVTPVAVPAGPGYQVPFAATLRREAGLPVAAVGMITSPAQAETLVRSDQADVVLLGRALLRQPYWPLQAAQDLHADGPWPEPYLRARS